MRYSLDRGEFLRSGVRYRHQQLLIRQDNFFFIIEISVKLIVSSFQNSSINYIMVISLITEEGSPITRPSKFTNLRTRFIGTTLHFLQISRTLMNELD